jgi:protein-S-isoprenylcysteine O-methyltransferase Ste14
VSDADGLMLRFPKRYADTVARLRVLTGFLLVGLFAWLSHPTAGSLAAGLPLSVLGLGLRAWAAGCLAKDRELATGGPYAYTRNPLYLGTLLVAAGLVVASRSIGLAALFTAVFVMVYLPAIQLEEQHLRRLFREYEAYAGKVPALWPRLTPFAKKPNPFRASQYLWNKEYEAGVGFLAGALFLIWKTISATV